MKHFLKRFVFAIAIIAACALVAMVVFVVNIGLAIGGIHG